MKSEKARDRQQGCSNVVEFKTYPEFSACLTISLPKRFCCTPDPKDFVSLSPSNVMDLAIVLDTELRDPKPWAS